MAFVARAFFDESGTGAESPDLCVAGYIFTIDGAQAFEAAWSEMLVRYGLAYFHMKECVHLDPSNPGRAGFGPLSMADRDAAARAGIKIIKAHASRGVAITIDKSAAAELQQGGIWQGDYAFVAGQAMYAVREWADHTGANGTVSYVYEAGADGWSHAATAARLVRAMPNDELRDSFRIGEYVQATKAEAVQLQAADMLAWHMRKHLQNLRQGNKKRRADFKELLKVPITWHHYDHDASEALQSIRANWSALTA